MKSRPIFAALVFCVAMGASALAAWASRPSHFTADSKEKVVLENIFPADFGRWKVDKSIVPIQPAPDLQRVLDETYDALLSRTYVNQDGYRIMLSVAYGRNQHEGMNTHRPEICYPGQGFPLVPNSAHLETFSQADRKFTVTKLVASTKTRNEPITYWLIVGDTVTTYGFKHKLVALQYGLRGSIPDGMLVRLSSIDPDNQRGFEMQKQFAAEMLASMSESSRAAVLGQGS